LRFITQFQQAIDNTIAIWVYVGTQKKENRYGYNCLVPLTQEGWPLPVISYADDSLCKLILYDENSRANGHVQLKSGNNYQLFWQDSRSEEHVFAFRRQMFRPMFSFMIYDEETDAVLLLDERTHSTYVFDRKKLIDFMELPGE